MITSISIKHFRSIENLTFKTNPLTTFVGPNDAGKSNILRALNLFFNEQTDHKSIFSFEKDFNKNAKVGKNKAKQIEIEITVLLPESFRKPDKPNEVTWRKVWREGGLHYPQIRQRYIDKSVFSSYSKIPTFLERLAFYYVPAIKDRHFFADLQGQMYDILAEAAESKLRDSAKAFEGNIQNQIAELMELVSDQFGSDSDVRLPENLRIVFESLEFNANDIPLSRRGDGIKIRHIPMILKFIGEKRNSLLTGGAIKYTNIWGFEEPENNLELSSAFDMAKSLENITHKGNQIFITTHSPAFYSIGMDKIYSPQTAPTIYRVRKENGTTQISIDDNEKLNEEMGLMPLIAPYVKREKDRWADALTRKDEDIRKLQTENDYSKPRMFVEGQSDKLVFEKTIELFYPHAKNKIKIDSGGKDGYGSSNAAVSRAFAWQLIQQTKKDPVCPAAAVLDGDRSGAESDEKLNILISQLGSATRKIAKCFILKKSKRIGQLFKEGFTIPNDLESYYPDDIWRHAKEENWLEDADISERISKEKINSLIKLNLDPLSEINDNDRLRIEFRWNEKYKIKAAKYVCSLPEQQCKEALEDVAVALKSCIKHLTLDEE